MTNFLSIYHRSRLIALYYILYTILNLNQIGMIHLLLSMKYTLQLPNSQRYSTHPLKVSRDKRGLWQMHHDKTYSHFNEIVEIKHKGSKINEHWHFGHPSQIMNKSVTEPSSNGHPDNIIIKKFLRPNLQLQFTPTFASPFAIMNCG
jgi:hypothetical protein